MRYRLLRNTQVLVILMSVVLQMVKVQPDVGVAVLMSVIVKMRKVHSGVGDTDVSCGIDGEVTL